MRVEYRSIEVAYGVLAGSMLILGSAVLFLLFVSASPALILPLLLVPTVALLLVWSITIEVTTEELRVTLGMRAGRRAQLKEIQEVSISDAPWYQGWGIRTSRHGYLYRVTGLRTVDVVLKTGEMIRVGTRQPHELKRALASAVRRRA